MPSGAKEEVDERGKECSVQTALWWNVGEERVGDAWTFYIKFTFYIKISLSADSKDVLMSWKWILIIYFHCCMSSCANTNCRKINWLSHQSMEQKYLTLRHIHHSHGQSAEEIRKERRLDRVFGQPCKDWKESEHRSFQCTKGGERVDVPKIMHIFEKNY